MIKPKIDDVDRMLTPAEAAVILRINTNTVAAWAGHGLIGYARTPGGHRRYREADVMALAATEGGTR